MARSRCGAGMLALASAGCSLSASVGEVDFDTGTSDPDPDLEGDDGDPDDGQRVHGDEDEARMITLVGVHANQGLEVEIARDGALLLPEDRALELVEGRETLITATWSTEPGFPPREIEAVLHVFPPGQTSYAISDVRFVAGGEADPDDLESTFNWILTPGLVVPGTEFSVELEEVGTMMQGMPFSDVPPRLPAKGRGQLAPVAGAMGVEVVLVPLRPIGSTFVIPAYWVDDFREQLYQFNPVQHAEVSLREPIEFDAAANGDELLYTLQDLRLADEAEPHVFYHGLYSPEFANVDAYGSYFTATAAAADAPLRVSTSRAATVYNSLHILGHNRGLQHIAGPATCPMISGDADEGFPNVDGTIGTRGWGVLDGEFRSPHRTYDFMSYCQTVWVSDYHWGLQSAYLRELGDGG